ncbi:MAG: agmatinase [Gammaproteobacteria bacterium]|jgi:guanidinobutyrase|nr:agmatinase [Gammaproteobacteria bacterium]MBP6050354.1 agmatinase [Pseudomonadales bacterium]MBK6583727.1 agmatinase [Gammaproteobacteria bacterium]MBK7170256.1 agmatinase [Gammaproteobacteria bacterium]MBK7727461.1 agmatinase [Gammaproteobacteria bacterium]
MSQFNQPLGGNEMPRFAGIASMFRLPVQNDARGLDVAICGVPLDLGTSNRVGTRYGPRQIRTESVLVRPYGMATGAAPFDSFQVADIGDVALNTYNLLKSIDIIEKFHDRILACGAKPVTLGGDHTLALPILRALAKKHGPLALVHVDAHADVNDTMFGERITHGTVFRRAIEENLIDPRRMVQIGLRATGYAADDFDWTRQQGARVVPAEECWYRSLAPLMAEVRAQIGPAAPTYLSFDIDGLDPSVAPGTGTPEPGGLSASQGIEVIRGCFGLNLVGCDLVEVSPPYDSSGNTALLAANLVFEMLCSLPGCIRRC